jgi:hypothetical protein
MLDGSHGKETSYGLESRDSITGWGKKFSLLHSVQIDSWTHPAFYPTDTGGLRFGSVKLIIRLHLLPRWWSCTSAPPYVFLYILIKLRHNFTFNFICHICLEQTVSHLLLKLYKPSNGLSSVSAITSNMNPYLHMCKI